jgi:peptidoglycan/LPS O-acetylase OafA/YrhL
MSRERRSDLVIGIFLLFIGGWFLAAQFNLVPKLDEIINIQYQWPMSIIGVGVLLFVLGLLTRNPGTSIPACIVGGIGGILYYTNSTGQWGAWAYLWTLIPGFVGIGIILSTLLGGEERTGYREGLRLIVISVIMFIIFFMLLSGQGNIIRFWPILVILAGIWIIVQTFFRKK